MAQIGAAVSVRGGARRIARPPDKLAKSASGKVSFIREIHVVY